MPLAGQLAACLSSSAEEPPYTALACVSSWLLLFTTQFCDQLRSTLFRRGSHLRRESSVNHAARVADDEVNGAITS